MTYDDFRQRYMYLRSVITCDHMRHSVRREASIELSGMYKTHPIWSKQVMDEINELINFDEDRESSAIKPALVDNPDVVLEPEEEKVK